MAPHSTESLIKEAPAVKNAATPHYPSTLFTKTTPPDIRAKLPLDSSSLSFLLISIGLLTLNWNLNKIILFDKTCALLHMIGLKLKYDYAKIREFLFSSGCERKEQKEGIE